METDAPKGNKKEASPVPAAFPDVLGAVAQGTFVPMAEIPDPTFSQGVLGVCCGVEPETGKVFSPMDGTISQLADTLHAVGHPATIMVAVANSDDLASVEAVASGHLKPGDQLMRLKA